MTERNLESLQAFQRWFVSPGGPGYTHIPLCAPTHHKAGMTALTLYRRNGYQAELVLIPPGQDYRVNGQSLPLMSLFFLGGSCDCRDSTLPGLSGPVEHRIPTPDHWQLQISDVMERPDFLERPHPVITQEGSRPFFSLSAGDFITLFATGQTGIMLFLGIYETDKACTCLDYVEAVPTQPVPRGKTA